VSLGDVGEYMHVRGKADDKLFLFLIKHSAMKMYEGVEVQVHEFLI
jgi:hypothetical protein